MMWLQLLVVVIDILLFGTVLLLLALMTAWVVSMHTDVPFVPTPRAHFLRIAETLAITSDDVVYELGSGDGRFLLWAAGKYPSARFVGIERNPLLHSYATLNKKLCGSPTNLEYRRGDLFDTNFKGPTKIYAYLLPKVMDGLLPLLEHSFRGRLASRAFQFSDKKPSATIELTKKVGSHGEHLLYVYDF